ncbi:MAG: hypothetical protein IPH08_05105 [Rhodocyclaceae bacterium]|nr:hypothetical protein [Rhodocyclaceae bacterium]
MTNLIKYNAARIALAEAHSVDEVKDIRDKYEAMAAYARQAKDTEMIQWVTEIKVRAERRAGQLLAEMPKAKGTQVNGGITGGPIVVPPVNDAKTLDQMGVSKNDSSRWQKLAAVPEEQFEQAVAAAKDIAGEVTTAAMLRAAKANEPEKPATPKPPKLEIVPDELASLRTENEELREAYAEQGKTIKELIDDNNSMAVAFEADDKLAALDKENKKLREMNRILEERVRGLQNECLAAKRAAQAWQRKAEKLA